MADSSVTFQPTPATPPTGTVISTRTNAAAEHMQVVLLGIDGSDSIVPVDATLGVTVNTELPDAAALADAAANPAAPAVAGFGMLWNGTTWDRAPGTAASGLKVQQAADNVTTGTITANGQTVQAAVVAGMTGLGLMWYGTFASGCTLNFEYSPDGGTSWGAFSALPAANSSAGATQALSAGTGTGVNAFSYNTELPIGATHVRMRASAFGASGTVNIRIAQSSQPRFPGIGSIAGVTQINAIIPGASATNLGKTEDAVAASGDTGVFALGVRNDAQATSTSGDGDYIQQSHDARGAVRVNTASFTYSHISTATTTVVKSGAGELHAISVNTKGTVASTITVFDNTAGSGTVIGVIDSLNLSGAFVLDVAFTTGLTIVTTGTVAPDLTVSYR